MSMPWAALSLCCQYPSGVWALLSCLSHTVAGTRDERHPLPIHSTPAKAARHVQKHLERLVEALCLLADNRLHLFKDLLGVTEEHISVILVEDGIISTSIARAHRALHDDHLVRLPHTQHRHACND